MAITAALVKELRVSTGAGMMDAKKALTETDGDMEAAVDWLRGQSPDQFLTSCHRIPNVCSHNNSSGCGFEMWRGQHLTLCRSRRFHQY